MALLPLATGVALANTGHGYSRIFTFGASFLDPGNHFALTGETAHPPFYPITPIHYPPSCGVGGHRFTNGRTWVEVMAQEMGLTEWAKPAFRDPAFGNYALGWARARQADSPEIPGLYGQVQAWIDNGYCTGFPMTDTLFVLDTVYFDMVDMLNGEDPFTVMPDMIQSIAINIGILYECGARNLLVANLPPLGVSPAIPEDDKEQSTLLSWLYNESVQDMLQLYSADMNISTVNFFTFTMVVMDVPELFGLTNVTDSCVSYGVVNDAFCKGRNGYFFWDPLHPSKKAHALMGGYALAQLPVLDSVYDD
jgi:hypothetical protein